MKTLVLNSGNYVAGSGNTFTYRFPTAISFAKGDRVGLANLAMTNSTYNISAARGNNSVSISWPTIELKTGAKLVNFKILTYVYWDATYNDYTFYFPDGYYTISQLNAYLQQQMFNQGLYLTANNAAQVVYFFAINTITSQYAVQVQAFNFPTADDATKLGYATPTGNIPSGSIVGLSGALAGTTYANAGSAKNFWCT